MSSVKLRLCVHLTKLEIGNAKFNNNDAMIHVQKDATDHIQQLLDYKCTKSVSIKALERKPTAGLSVWHHSPPIGALCWKI